MKQTVMAAAPLMLFLAISGCSEKRINVPIPIPAERVDCTVLDGRPTVPKEYVIDWTRVQDVAQAEAEHKSFVTRLREREKIIGGSDGYIVQLEGRLFVCANDALWIRNYLSRLPGED